MTFTPFGLLRRAGRRIGNAALVALLACACSGASADEGQAPMLSLGDSVVFGFIDESAYAYVNPDNFLAYPKLVGHEVQLAAVNASCPGETTSSFLSTTGVDNGCRDYRANFPLHVNFRGTQMEFARSYIGAHRNTRLVTVSLGANDGFLLQAACKGDTACITAGLPALLATVYSNVNTILSNVRASGLHGALIVVNYYSLDYSDQAQTGFTMALNSALANAAAANGAVVADAFTSFQKEANKPYSAGSTCKAGLLNGSATGSSGCDVHPSLTGQWLLAQTVQAAYRGTRRWTD